MQLHISFVSNGKNRYALFFLCVFFLGIAPVRALAASLLVPQRVPAASLDADGDGLEDGSEGLLQTDAALADTDRDGLADGDEVLLFGTDPRSADTDGDTFLDGLELLGGYSPHKAGKKLSEIDTDSDSLSDAAEFGLRTNLTSSDTDRDGYGDGEEVRQGFDPRLNGPVQRKKSVTIHTRSQRLRYYFDGVQIGEFPVSTGKRATPTPIGTFTITSKHPRAWSARNKLWMPWWMNFTGGRLGKGQYGMHELPEWPGGKKEGAAHLGIPVSGGCVRLGIGPAKFLYDWTPVGTEITIRAD